MLDRLSQGFIEGPTLLVARRLLGQVLVRRLGGKQLGGRIVEVEAYIGEADTACHACRGPTRRNEAMYGPPGRAYVYFTYGMHWMLNVVTEREGFPAAVLLRALEPTMGLKILRSRRGDRADTELTSGPARLCQALGIDRAHNGLDLLTAKELFLAVGEPVREEDVLATPRIGIDYAQRRDREALWRFALKSSPHVSRGRAPVVNRGKGT